MKPFACAKCENTFRYKKGVVRHLKSHDATKVYECPRCGKLFKRIDVLAKHVKIHYEGKYVCPTCEKGFHRRGVLNKHQKIHNEVGEEEHMEVDGECEEFFEEAALRGTLKKFILKAATEKDPVVFIGGNKAKITDRLQQMLKRGGIKWFLSVQVAFKKEEKTAEPVF